MVVIKIHRGYTSKINIFTKKERKVYEGWKEVGLVIVGGGDGGGGPGVEIERDGVRGVSCWN